MEFLTEKEINRLATERAIEDFIKQVEKEKGKPLEIPEVNKKNAYLKTCWLLSQLQKAVNQARSIGRLPVDIESGVRKAESNIRFLKNNLPMLREYYITKN